MSTPSKWGPEFTKEELMCRCGCGKGEEMMDDTFMRNMVLLRRRANFPFPVTSAYRCPAYNSEVSSTGRKGPHTTGCAMDVALDRFRAYTALRLAMESLHFTGIGVRQHGNSRFLHFDNLPADEGRPRPTIWSYK